MPQLLHLQSEHWHIMKNCGLKEEVQHNARLGHRGKHLFLPIYFRDYLYI